MDIIHQRLRSFILITCCQLQKWIPAMHERWLVVKTNYEPHLQSLCKRSSEAYEASKQALTPHIIRAQEFAYPYFQVYILQSFVYLIICFVPALYYCFGFIYFLFSLSFNFFVYLLSFFPPF